MALLLNVILLMGKLTFKKIFIFSYYYLKYSLGEKDKLCEIKGVAKT